MFTFLHFLQLTLLFWHFVVAPTVRAARWRLRRGAWAVFEEQPLVRPMVLLKYRNRPEGQKRPQPMAEVLYRS